MQRWRDLRAAVARRVFKVSIILCYLPFNSCVEGASCRDLRCSTFEVVDCESSFLRRVFFSLVEMVQACSRVTLGSYESLLRYFVVMLNDYVVTRKHLLKTQSDKHNDIWGDDDVSSLELTIDVN